MSTTSINQKKLIPESKIVSICNNLFSFLISTSIFIALTSILELYFSFLLFSTLPNLNILLSFSFTVYSIYGLNKLTDIEEDAVNNPERAKIIAKICTLFKFSLAVSFILSLILGFSVNVLALPALLFPLFMGVIYSIGISSHIPRLKDITGVKNLIIALSWGVPLALLPAIDQSMKQFIVILIIFYIFFIKSLINSILFDIRDIEGDRISGVKTIPIFLGINKTKRLLLILNSTLIPLIIFSYGYFYKYFFVLVFIIVYGYWYILYFCQEGLLIGKSLDLFVDGEFIPISVLALIFSGELHS